MKSALSVLLAILFLTLFGCRKEPCASVVCENDGYCENGKCYCPEGFVGPSCGQESIPEFIHINRVTLRSWPEAISGEQWDPSSTADIYIVLLEGDNILWKSPYKFSDVKDSISYIFNVEPTIAAEPLERYTLRLWDHDEDESDDYMGERNFQLDGSREYPSDIHYIHFMEGDISFILRTTYEY